MAQSPEGRFLDQRGGVFVTAMALFFAVTNPLRR